MSRETLRTYYWSEYSSWKNMKQRCRDRRNYRNCGIKVCERWINSFENFLEDMGEKPDPKEEYTLERINNNGNYESNNCRWDTYLNQANNTKSIKTNSNQEKEICKLYRAGISQRKLSKLYDVSQAHISRVIASEYKGKDLF